MVWIALATEDELSEQVGIRLANEAGLEIGLPLRKNGNGYLRKRIPSFCEMAKRQPVLLITDLDRGPCAPTLVADWLNGRTRPEALLFRVAVREIESWLLADHQAMRALFGQKAGKLPDAPDDLPDPKQTLLGLAQRAKREVRDDLVASDGTVASQGLGYNARLRQIVREAWEPARAANRSPSLLKTRAHLLALGQRLGKSLSATNQT
jgi:hypothetical protein